MELLLAVAYRGTTFAGCAGVAGRRTVVGEVRSAFARLGGEVAVDPLSRTDAGVHALGNVLVVSGAPPRSDEAWLRALDRQLPPDLRPVRVATVDAVPSVRAKRYRYAIDASRWGDPQLVDRAWRRPVPLDALVPLGAALVGRRDFSAFRRRGETRADLVRTLHEARWSCDGDRLLFDVAGDGFAYRLVRSLVGGMVQVACGAIDAGAWSAALAGTRTEASRQQAPAHGLCLVGLTLDPEPTWAC